MNARVKGIIVCSIIGIFLLAIVEGMIIPYKQKQKQQYEISQQNPLTHDIESVLEYQSPYMGDASNLINLFYALPLRIERDYELYSEKLTMRVNYHEKVKNIGKEKVMVSILYNSITAFALIDNLQEVDYHFQDKTYKIVRSQVESFYDVPLNQLLEKQIWTKQVQEKLKDQTWISLCVEEIKDSIDE